MQAAIAALPPEQPERRAFVRQKVSLFGRFMTPDKVEYPCQVIDLSPAGMGVICAYVGDIGMPVICYVTHIGRVEGTIVRHFTGGFGMALVASARKREKLVAKLEWIVSHAEYGTPDDRIHERRAPRSPLTEVKMADGRAYRCKIIDISLSGAAIEIDVRPELGARLNLGGLDGIVVRHFDEGIALEFLRLQQDDSLSRFVT